MNILFCGDRNIEDGLMIVIASLLRNVKEELSIYIFTMHITTEEREFYPVSSQTVSYLDAYVKKKNPNHFVKLFDITELFQKDLPTPNMDTRFTPFCMLRLYADQIDEIPDRILYLDTDVICRKDPSEFYDQDMEGIEVAGVLDYYGQWFFHTSGFHFDYLNSGVLLMNMKRIRETGLFSKCRTRCREKKMFMPDQSAINKLAQRKKICDRKYNEQHNPTVDTVMQHFTTRFVFFPWVHVLTVKPWQIDQVHRKLKISEYDNLLEEYKKMKEDIERM